MVGEPIVVVGFPRSGTSLTCGLLHAHGIWVGETALSRWGNERGSFENERIKRLAVGRFGHLLMKARMAEFQPGLRAEISAVMLEQGYSGGPWLMKWPAVYLPALREYNPIFVKVYRSAESILESIRASNMFNHDDRDIVDAIKLSFWEMNKLKGFDVHPSRFVNGDFKDLMRVLEHIGLPFDPEAARSFTDKELWHF